MKFWRQTLITAFAFLSIASTVLYTACEKDSCSDLTCQNGGSCTAGACHCPTGYEGTECESRSVDRYLGTYYGVTTCDNAPGIIDTVDVTIGGDLTSVVVFQHTKGYSVDGTINASPSGYSIVVPKDVSGSFSRTVTITLDVKKLTINTNTVNGASTSTCTFIGNKQ